MSSRGALGRVFAVGVALSLTGMGVAALVGLPATGGGTAAVTTTAADADAAIGAAPGREDGQRGERDGGAERGRAQQDVAVAPGGEAGEMSLAASSLVEQLAYPRGYVTSGQALRARAAAAAAPTTLAATAFRPGVGQAAVRGQAGAAWQEVGPVGLAKPPSSPWPSPAVVAGRVTAVVVDPACGQAGHGCRAWMGSAGGGVWRTPDATAADPQWTSVSAGIPSDAIGSLALDPNDATGDTIYAGTGEANGSSDSEAGVGLYASTDGGDHWSLVPGSRAVAHDRSIGSVAIRPGATGTIVIGVGRGRHGAGQITSGSFTPPDAPALGVYQSTDSGQSFSSVLAPTQPGGSAADRTDTPRGSATQVEYDPLDAAVAYAAVTGSGLWRRAPGGTWSQVYTAADPTDESARVSFALIVNGGARHLYVLDGSFRGRIFRALDLDAHPLAPTWEAISPDSSGAAPAVTANQYGGYALCGEQCVYDMFIAGNVRGGSDVVWAGGSTAYDEVTQPFGSPLSGMSNGRAVVRSANANAVTASSVAWTDVTSGANNSKAGTHPDLHAIAFNPSQPDQAFIGSDGGLTRTDAVAGNWFTDASAQCADRTSNITGDADRLARCQQLLSVVPSRVTGINSGLSTLQVTGVGSSTASPGALVSGYQDNGTALNGGGSTWTGIMGGDGGMPAFGLGGTGTVFQQYYGGTVQVSFDGGAPGSFFGTYAPMSDSNETPPFYAALVPDPVTPGTVYSGWQHVWRSTDNGGTRQALLAADCGETGTGFAGCGDYEPMGALPGGAGLGADRQGGTISAVARTTGDAGTMWIATSKGRVLMTRNANATSAADVQWTRLDDDSALTPTRFPSGIAIDATDPNHAWVSYAGYNAYTPSTPGHLFEVRVDPASGTSTWVDRSYDLGDMPLRTMAYDPTLGDIYAAGDWGVLRLPGGATAWMDAGTGLPQVATYGMSIQPGQRVLYAATHGRGVYSLTLPDPAPGPAPPAPMPSTEVAPAAVSAPPGAVTVRILSKGQRLGVGTSGRVRIQVAAVGEAGTGTITLNGGLPPRERRPATMRLAQRSFPFGRYTRTTVLLTLPRGSLRALGAAGRMYANVVVRMTPTGGPTTSATSRVLLVAAPALRLPVR